MKKFIQSKFWQILGGVIGALAGYIYWKEIGCSTGTCPITSKPLNSVVYFGVLGYFVSGTIKDFKVQRTKNKVQRTKYKVGIAYGDDSSD
jgi:hypothetical protein